LVSAAAALLAMAGCSTGPPRAPAIGEAYVGPATLKIRADLVPTSATVATVKHGDRLQILQTHRRIIKVRTADGKEGWTDERLLLAGDDMKALHDLATRAAKLPSQGVASTERPLNIHTQPALSSPSFLQLKENEKFDVLQSVMLARADAPRTPLIPPGSRKTKLPPRKTKKEGRVPLPPMPKPPPLPEDWMELSRTDREEQAAAAADQPPPHFDGWSLVRTPSGQAGWVLTRMLSMGIPDEVAQYAEGHRIVSYFSLGETNDGAQKKNIWLWTTTTNSHADWDFDSFRVFIWSVRRHRYETAHIERNLKGYAPVLLHDVEMTGKAQAGRYPGFSICMEKKDGTRLRREYAMLGQAVRLAGEQPCEAPSAPVTLQAKAPLPVSEAPPPAPAQESFLDKLKRKLKLKK
jgi:hypothetical protein